MTITCPSHDHHMTIIRHRRQELHAKATLFAEGCRGSLTKVTPSTPTLNDGPTQWVFRSFISAILAVCVRTPRISPCLATHLWYSFVLGPQELFAKLGLADSCDTQTCAPQ